LSLPHLAAELARRNAEIGLHAGALLTWDQATYMPYGGAVSRSRQSAMLRAVTVFPEKAAFQGVQSDFTLLHSIRSFVSPCAVRPPRAPASSQGSQVRPSYATAAAPSAGFFMPPDTATTAGALLDAFDQYLTLPSVFERKLDLIAFVGSED
jgi:hypothetical protein